VELFAQQVAAMLENESLMQLADQRAHRLQQLYEMGSMLARSLDEPTILRALARQVDAMLDVATVTVLTMDQAGTAWPRVFRRDDAEQDEMYTPAAVRTLGAMAGRKQRQIHEGSALAVPAVIGPTTVSIVVVETRNQRPVPTGDADLLMTMTAQAGAAISNARLYSESLRQRRQTEALADVSRAVGESLRIDDVLHLILRHSNALLRTDGATIALIRGDALEVTAGIGAGKAMVGSRLALNGTMSGRAVRTASSIIAEDVHVDSEAFGPSVAAVQVRNTVIVPLLSAQGPVGALAVFNRQAPFTETDAEILQRLADHVAVAVVNARLFEEVEQSTREWAIAFDSIGSGMVILDARGRIQRSNAPARALMHTGPADASALIGQDFHTALFGDTSACSDCIHFAAMMDATVKRGTHSDHARGRVFDVTAAPHPLGGAVVTFDDVTAHRQLAERHRRVLETARDAIVITDRDRRIAFANPAAHALLGRGEELIGLPTDDVVPEEARGMVREFEDRGFAGTPQSYQGMIIRPDGEKRVVAINTAPLSELGEVTGVVASMRDVTDEKRLGEQLLQQEKLVAIGQLVSGVAHELNNPLAGVMAFAQLMLASHEPLTIEQRHAVDTIHREARRAAKIVSNLLTFARQQPAERRAANVNTIVSDTIELRRYALRTGEVDVTLSLDASIPETWADPMQLQQVMLNLLTNAEQALAERPGRREVRIRTWSERGSIHIEVADNGPGIASHLIDRVFNPFFTTKPVGQGTGLGLSLSDGIVREHGGRIQVASRPGHGAAFTIELPHVQPPEERHEPQASERSRRFPIRRMLVIDDEPAMRAAVSGFLRSLGHEVHVAQSTAVGRALMAKNEYDVVLLDLRMPDEGGETFFRDLQERDPFHAQRVVFVTGDLQSAEARRFLNAAKRPVVGKPFQLDELADIIANVAAG
jgi:PAS domain S-box-containing protein